MPVTREQHDEAVDLLTNHLGKLSDSEAHQLMDMVEAYRAQGPEFSAEDVGEATQKLQMASAGVEPGITWQEAASMTTPEMQLVTVPSGRGKPVTGDVDLPDRLREKLLSPATPILRQNTALAVPEGGPVPASKSQSSPLPSRVRTPAQALQAENSSETTMAEYLDAQGPLPLDPIVELGTQPTIGRADSRTGAEEIYTPSVYGKSGGGAFDLSTKTYYWEEPSVEEAKAYFERYPVAAQRMGVRPEEPLHRDHPAYKWYSDATYTRDATQIAEDADARVMRTEYMDPGDRSLVRAGDIASGVIHSVGEGLVPGSSTVANAIVGDEWTGYLKARNRERYELTLPDQLPVVGGEDVNPMGVIAAFTPWSLGSIAGRAAAPVAGGVASRVLPRAEALAADVGAGAVGGATEAIPGELANAYLEDRPSNVLGALASASLVGGGFGAGLGAVTRGSTLGPFIRGQRLRDRNPALRQAEAAGAKTRPFGVSEHPARNDLSLREPELRQELKVAGGRRLTAGESSAGQTAETILGRGKALVEDILPKQEPRKQKAFTADAMARRELQIGVPNASPGGILTTNQIAAIVARAADADTQAGRTLGPNTGGNHVVAAKKFLRDLERRQAFKASQPLSKSAATVFQTAIEHFYDVKRVSPLEADRVVAAGIGHKYSPSEYPWMSALVRNSTDRDSAAAAYSAAKAARARMEGDVQANELQAAEIRAQADRLEPQANLALTRAMSKLARAREGASALLASYNRQETKKLESFRTAGQKELSAAQEKVKKAEKALIDARAKGDEAQQILDDVLGSEMPSERILGARERRYAMAVEKTKNAAVALQAARSELEQVRGRTTGAEAEKRMERETRQSLAPARQKRNQRYDQAVAAREAAKVDVEAARAGLESSRMRAQQLREQADELDAPKRYEELALAKMAEESAKDAVDNRVYVAVLKPRMTAKQADDFLEAMWRAGKPGKDTDVDPEITELANQFNDEVMPFFKETYAARRASKEENERILGFASEMTGMRLRKPSLEMFNDKVAREGAYNFVQGWKGATPAQRQNPHVDPELAGMLDRSGGMLAEDTGVIQDPNPLTIAQGWIGGSWPRLRLTADWAMNPIRKREWYGGYGAASAVPSLQVAPQPIDFVRIEQERLDRRREQ